MSELTLKEFQSKGGKTTAQRHKDKLAEWGRRGGQKTKDKYGIEHFTKIRKITTV